MWPSIPSSDPVEIIDDNGNQSTTTRDRRGRVRGRSITPGPSVAGTTFESYSYDGVGRMTFGEDDDFGPDEIFIDRAFVEVQPLLEHDARVVIGKQSDLVRR